MNKRPTLQQDQKKYVCWLIEWRTIILGFTRGFFRNACTYRLAEDSKSARVLQHDQLREAHGQQQPLTHVVSEGSVDLLVAADRAGSERDRLVPLLPRARDHVVHHVQRTHSLRADNLTEQSGRQVRVQKIHSVVRFHSGFHSEI